MVGNVRLQLKRHTGWVYLLAGILLAWPCTHSVAGGRLTLNFNPDWKFIKADPANAATTSFDDSDWTTVSTPHTYNDTDTFDDWSMPGHRGEQNQWSGRTWYRKTFTVPPSFKGRKVFIEFGAVRQFAEVYLNNHLLGACKTGFTPFGFDLTPHLRFDGPNVLAVMCDNRFMKDPPADANGGYGASHDRGKIVTLAQLSARVNQTIPEDVSVIAADQIPWNNPHWHPAHGGIYRNVRLYVTDPLHISLPLYSFLQTSGPYVYATDISTNAATLHIEVPVQNERATPETIHVRAEVLDRHGKTRLSVTQAALVPAGGGAAVTLSGTLANPELWEPGYPYMYRVVCSLSLSGSPVDSCEIPLGIRTVRWSAESGFFINGRHLKLRGWGQKPTDEWPGIGTAQPDWLHFFTLNLMKEAGANWVRWGHCLAGPEQIKACDELGLAVQQPGVDGEADTRGAAWQIRATAFRDAVIYFRNNPSILVWEGGNQKVSREHASELHSYLEQYDPRGGRAFTFRRADQTTAEFMDVGTGTEGGREIAHLPVVEGEYDREESPRRVWDEFSPPNFGYPEGKGQTYDLNSEQFAVNQVTQFVRKLGATDHCGGANWIFSDSTSGGRVSCEVARTSGEVDGVRLPKEAYYVCQAMFRPEPQVHIIGHWNYPAGTIKTVYIVSNCERVELLVNGNSIGQAVASEDHLFQFQDVLWEAGEIKAVAFKDGRIAASQVKRTAGPPVALRLTPITGPTGLQADGADIALIDVEAVDAEGERCPTVQQRVEFAVEGNATWLGGYNSGRTHSIRKTQLDLECGINRVALRATRTRGEITLRARSQNLKPAKVVIQTSPVEVASGYSTEFPATPVVLLPENRPLQTAAIDDPASSASPSPTPGTVGRFARAFSYSGPTTIVHLERGATNGKNVYVDRDYAFTDLPAELNGADWVQAANSDCHYEAVDLMEIAVADNAVVLIAHDAELPRPNWLATAFQPTDLQLTINGRAMSVFERKVGRSESLTLGPNSDTRSQKACNMYVVFVKAGSGGHADMATGNLSLQAPLITQ
jgi:beta-galactosidase